MGVSSPSPAGKESLPSSPASRSRLLSQLPRIFSILLIVAAIGSVLSTLAFLGYILLPKLVSSQPQSQFAALYAIGIVGLAIAEACQILGVLTLIGQWTSRTNIEKRPKELAVLLVSLIPYMVVVIFLITLVVYVRARQQNPASERTSEAAQELKEQVVDTLIDTGANTSSSVAGSPATPVTSAPAVSLSTRPTMQQAISRVVGPSTGKTVSDSAHGLVAFAAVALLVAAAPAAGIAVESKAFSSPQSPTTASAVSLTPTSVPVPIRKSVVGNWQGTAIFTTGQCSVYAGCPDVPFNLFIYGNSPALIQWGSESGAQQITVVFADQKITIGENSTGCNVQFKGSVLAANKIGGTFSMACSPSSGAGTWTASQT